MKKSSYLLAKSPSPTPTTCPHLISKYLQRAKTLPKGPRHLSYSSFPVRSKPRISQQRLMQTWQQYAMQDAMRCNATTKQRWMLAPLNMQPRIRSHGTNSRVGSKEMRWIIANSYSLFADIFCCCAFLRL